MKYFTHFTLSKEMKYLIALAFPIVGSNLFQLAYNIVDMVWVGHLGSNAVAAVGSAGFYLNLSWAFATIITMGVNVKVSQSVGAGNKSEQHSFSSSGLFSIVLLAIVFFTVIYTNAEHLIAFYEIGNVEVEETAVSFLRLSLFAYFFSFINLFFVSLINAYGYTSLSFRSSIIGIVANIILDPIFIFGFKMGVEGAAWATIVGFSLSAVSLLYYVFVKKIVRFGNFKFEKRHLKQIIGVGLPASLQRILFIVIYIFLAKIIALWGPTALAVQKVGVQIEAISYMLVGGLSQAMAIAVGHCYGAMEYNRLRKTYFAGVKIAVLVGAINTVLFLFIPEILFSFFFSESQSIKLGGDYLRILAFSQVFMCFEMISAGAYNGLGKTYIPAFISILNNALRVPVAYLLGKYTFLELNGVWLSVSITSFVKGVVLFILFSLTLKYLLEDPNVDQTAKSMACKMRKSKFVKILSVNSVIKNSK
ncbi:MAG: MATE family efflux transporter [Bacteroidales bacterium]